MWLQDWCNTASHQKLIMLSKISDAIWQLTSLSATASRCVLRGTSGWVPRGRAKDNILNPSTERGTMSGNFHRLIITYNEDTSSFLGDGYMKSLKSLLWFLGNIQWLAEVVYPLYHLLYSDKGHMTIQDNNTAACLVYSHWNKMHLTALSIKSQINVFHMKMLSQCTFFSKFCLWGFIFFWVSAPRPLT